MGGASAKDQDNRRQARRRRIARAKVCFPHAHLYLDRGRPAPGRRPPLGIECLELFACQRTHAADITLCVPEHVIIIVGLALYDPICGRWIVRWYPTRAYVFWRCEWNHHRNHFHAKLSRYSFHFCASYSTIELCSKPARISIEFCSYFYGGGLARKIWERPVLQDGALPERFVTHAGDGRRFKNEITLNVAV